MTWLKHQGADTVADLNQLPPGTYSCKDLAESLRLPMLKAQRLLSALEGTKSSAIHPEATLHCAALCTLKPRRPARDHVAVLHAILRQPVARQVLSSRTRRRTRSRSRSLLRQCDLPPRYSTQSTPDPMTRPVHTVLRALPACPPPSQGSVLRASRVSTQSTPQQPEPTITKDATLRSICSAVHALPATSRRSQPARAGQCRV
jgi:hypothetical protein